ncbi:MAG: mechanosensitive ion channel, partial [Anaerovorax sp.]
MSDKLVNGLISVGIAVAIVIVGYVVLKILCNVAKKALIKGPVDDALIPFIINCARVFAWILILVTALDSLGVSPAAFITALGAAGVAVALALKDSLGNFAGGILIILTKPFGKGDYIEDYQTAGKV